MSYGNMQKGLLPKLQGMPSELITEVIEIFSVQSNSENEHRVVHYITQRLTEMGIPFEIDKAGNIIATKGVVNDDEFYPCIAAHMDTVHEIWDNFKLRLKRKKGRLKLLASNGRRQVGCGGDDKCGIMSVFDILKRVDAVKAVFFTQEEIGLVGSSLIDHSHFDNVGYIIQLDRWGSSDLICLNGGYTVSDEFLGLATIPMEMHGYKEEHGLITDSINLFNDRVGKSCVNVSCGYYQHHSDGEYVDLNELYNALLFTRALIDALGKNEYQKMPEIVQSKAWRGYTPSSWHDMDYHPWTKQSPALDESRGYGWEDHYPPGYVDRGRGFEDDLPPSSDIKEDVGVFEDMGVFEEQVIAQVLEDLFYLVQTGEVSKDDINTLYQYYVDELEAYNMQPIHTVADLIDELSVVDVF